MNIIINFLLFPFQYSLIGFGISAIILSSVAFFAGNKPEYMAFFQIFIALSFLLNCLKFPTNTTIALKKLMVPIILIALIFFIHYTKQQSFDSLSISSATEKVNFLINQGIFVPYSYVWHMKYWLCILCLCIMVYNVGHLPKFKKNFLNYLLVTITISAVYGIYVYITGNKSVLWVHKTTYINDLTATFVNRNSYAILLNCGILIGLYKTLYTFKNFIKSYKNNTKNYIIGLIDYCTTPHIASFVMMIIMIAALILTHSRSGIILTFLSSSLLYLLISNTFSFKRKMIILSVITVFCIIIAPFIMPEFFNRSIHIQSHSDLRLNTYLITLKMIAHYPIWGIGLGGFEYAFQVFRDNMIDIHSYWDKSHSTPLTIMLEIGLPCALLLLSFYTYIITFMIKSYQSEQKKFLLICLMIIFVLILHSCIDFSLEMPALNIIFHIILTLGYLEAKKSSLEKIYY